MMMKCTPCLTCGGCSACFQQTTGCRACSCVKITFEPRGWICPVCNGGVAPMAQRCPCVPQPYVWGGPGIIGGGEITCGDPPGSCSSADTGPHSLMLDNYDI
jgi:hypothetical protein